MYRTLLIAGAGAWAMVVTLAAVDAQTRPPSGTSSRARPVQPHGDPQGWKFKLPQGDAARGRSAFEAFECYACHEVKGETFPPPTKRDTLGPELSAMGQHHSSAFLAESIANPGAVVDKGRGFAGPDGSSKMPSFADSMSVQQLIDLVTYLTGLRPPAAPAGPGHRH